MKKVFLDTAGILALVNKRDSLHEKAIQTNSILLFQKVEFVITDYILVEIANALSKNKSLAIKALNYLRNSKDVKIYQITDKQFNESLQIYEKFLDKDWGLTDITSFIVMKENSISDAFTNDHHFEQYGFHILI